MDKTLVEAIRYAVCAHQDVNESYDGAPYSLHLAMAAHYADVFSYLLPSQERDETLAAVWLHDVIEDCRRSYNDIKAVFGEKIAELVFAVTNNRGLTRHERANDDYYRGIVATPYATFVNYATGWPTPNTRPREAMRGWWRSIGRNSMLFWKNFPPHGKRTTHPCGKNRKRS